jgi:hypothetical protein
MASDYYQHEATLTDLSAATTYQYDVYVGGVDLTPQVDRLTTAPPVGTGSISFVAFGDSGSGTSNQRQLAELMSAQFGAGRWDFAVHTGDVVYPKGSYQLLHDRFFDIYQDWLRRYPISLAVGNHEDYVNDGRPYLDLFSLPDNGYTPRFPDQTERYYSFDYGPVHFIALDTQIAFAGERQREQLTWLVRDLEATTQPWRIVFFHIPAYGSSDFASAFSKRRALQPIFERYGVQLVLAGHEHAYARGGPWREPPSAQAAVMHVVTGGGGASLTHPSPGPWLVNWARAYHYLSIDVSDCTPSGACALTLEAVGLNGQPFDAFTLDLRAQQQDAAAPTVVWNQPASGAVVSGPAVLSATASDDQEVVKVDVLVDGALRLVDTGAPYEWAWDTTRELNGDRNLELRALDIAGRVAASETRVVRVANPQASLMLLSPNGSEVASTAAPYHIRWAAGAGSAPLTRFRVEVAPNGRTFNTIAECATLSASARECVWNAPGPTSSKAVVRVTAIDALGQEVATTSAAFRIQSAPPTVTVKFPNSAATVGVGSTQSLFWTSPLGLFGTWRVELSRDGGSNWETIAPAFLLLENGLRWTANGPATSEGLVRVSNANVAVHDVSDALFTIAPPSLAVTGLPGSTVWTANTQTKVKWTTNLGEYDRLNVRLSTDGGNTFPLIIAGAVPAAARMTTVTVPPVSTSSARILIEALGNSAWKAISSANFRIVLP